MASSTPLTLDGISSLKVVTLRQELDKRGLEKSGLKADLVKRLEKVNVVTNPSPNAQFQNFRTFDQFAASYSLLIPFFICAQSLLEESLGENDIVNGSASEEEDEDAQINKEEEEIEENEGDKSSPVAIYLKVC